MRRCRFRKPTISVALFPFLAVLVCTMGALIVLLVLVVQQARVYASVIADPPPADAESVNDELREQHAEFKWRREVLENQRTELTENLANSRLQLAYLEDHIRRLEEKWTQLQAVAAELEEIKNVSDQSDGSARKQRESLRAQIDAAQEELVRVRSEVDRRPRSFAIIPYAGPNGTQRRPIYIECTAHGIVLQPEGVVLRAQDFDGPLGPGNPLDAALRAIREHLASLGTAEWQGEPYPLLVVRPDGAIAYNVARLAMRAWDDEFGYELIDADMKVQYPTPDAYLKQLLESTIENARQRQAALAAAMPSQFQGDRIGGFVASSSGGGFVPVSTQGAGFGAGRGADAFGRESDGAGAPAGFPPLQSSMAHSSAADAGNPPDQRAPGTAAGPGGPNAAAGGAPGGTSTALSQTRGRDWALPKSAGSATAITRPIRIVCHPDRLVVLPQRGEIRAPRVVDMPRGPQFIVDRFVNMVWEQVREWGIAIAGGYWKPTLQVAVAPGAEVAYQQLVQLLDQSGLELERVAR
jgi:hypothetical protein